MDGAGNVLRNWKTWREREREIVFLLPTAQEVKEESTAGGVKFVCIIVYLLHGV